MFLWRDDLAVVVEDAEVHGLGVKIDSAVVGMGLGVESHGSLLELVGVCVQPAYSDRSRFEEGAWMRIMALNADLGTARFN